MKALSFALIVSFFSTLAQAETILIPLNTQDQARLTKDLSKIEVSFRTRTDPTVFRRPRYGLTPLA